MVTFKRGRIVAREGDCLAILPTLEENSVDAIVTDAPYHLKSIVKRFAKSSLDDDNKTMRRLKGRDDAHARFARGFVGQSWDDGDIAFDPNTWSAMLRVLKPGGHLIAMGGKTTFSRMSVAIEDSGFEMRDTVLWLYGTSMPKSHDQGDGWGTDIKTCVEFCAVARKPLSERTVLANMKRWGTGAINIEACRVDVGKATKRWPANVTHDGAVNGFPTEFFNSFEVEKRQIELYYSAKANVGDRIDIEHPTVKPIALMRWLIRLVTPPGGLVLDPFAGSGTTGEAAFREGMCALLIEREHAYFKDICKRMQFLNSPRAMRVAAKDRSKERDTFDRTWNV